MSRMYCLSPSILAANCAKLGEEIACVARAGVPWLHIDVMDGQFVPALSFGDPIVQGVRQACDLFLDVHLMVEEPARFIPAFQKAGADMLTVHAEACRHLDRTLTVIREAGLRAGVAMNPATPVSCLDYVLDKTDMVLQMTVNPGFGGQKYIPAMTQKIRDLRAKLDAAGYTDLPIQVDGGINEQTLDTVLQAGASIIVAGSAVFRGDVEQNARVLQAHIEACAARQKESGLCGR